MVAARPPARPPPGRVLLRDGPFPPRTDRGDGLHAGRVLPADVGPVPLLPPPADAAVDVRGRAAALAGIRAAHGAAAAGALPAAVAGRGRGRGLDRRLQGRLQGGLRGVLHRHGDQPGHGVVLRPAALALGAPDAVLDAAARALRPHARLAAVRRPPPVGAPRAALLPRRAGDGRVHAPRGRPPRGPGPLPQPPVLVGLPAGLPAALPRLSVGLVPAGRPRPEHDDAEPALLVAPDHQRAPAPQEVLLRRLVHQRAEPLLHLLRHCLLRERGDLALRRPRPVPAADLQPPVLLDDGRHAAGADSRRGPPGRVPGLHAHPDLHRPHLLQGPLRPRARASPPPRRARGEGRLGGGRGGRQGGRGPGRAGRRLRRRGPRPDDRLRRLSSPGCARAG